MEGLRKNGALSGLSGRQMSVFPQEGNSGKENRLESVFHFLVACPSKRLLSTWHFLQNYGRLFFSISSSVPYRTLLEIN